MSRKATLTYLIAALQTAVPGIGEPLARTAFMGQSQQLLSQAANDVP